ncbi:hypothetical protein PROFUN_04649 [Planoprotostelium fungivorum]|uniref:Uncharacterized protein n=1 Tax=Planoprotostelium fungivorum TaxID=1890364 RepID=A0A2P6NUG9_9EUKA|nr:hypothetical protein PROFUN_04649 [Planoprotostelium fungivorum]
MWVRLSHTTLSSGTMYEEEKPYDCTPLDHVFSSCVITDSLTMRKSIVALFLFAILATSAGNIEDDEEFIGDHAPETTKTVTLPTQSNIGSQASILIQHSFGGDFEDRGRIKVSSRNYIMEQSEWSTKDKGRFETLTKTNGFYRIRAQTSSGQYSVSSVRVCDLVTSDYHDHITIHKDIHGELIHVDYTVSRSTSRGPCHEEYLQQKANKLETHVHVQHTTESSQAIIEPKIVQQQAEKQAQEGESQSFFGKYWYFIVPALIMMVLNSVLATMPDPAQGQAGAAARPGAAPAAARRVLCGSCDKYATAKLSANTIRSSDQRRIMPLKRKSLDSALDDELSSPSALRKRAAKFGNAGFDFEDDDVEESSSTSLFAPIKPKKMIRINKSPEAPAALKGTNQNVEKSYLRLTDAAQAKNVRSEEILSVALLRLKNRWNGKTPGVSRTNGKWSEEDSHYFTDQMKAIRQDLVVQGIRNRFTLSVYQFHAEVALEFNDKAEFGQCITMILQLYQEMGIFKEEEKKTSSAPKMIRTTTKGKPIINPIRHDATPPKVAKSKEDSQHSESTSPDNVDRYLCYHLLFLLSSDNQMDYQLFCKKMLHTPYYSMPSVTYARKTWQSYINREYGTFFKRYEDPIHDNCRNIINWVINEVRKKCIERIHATFEDAPLDMIVSTMAFDDPDECVAFLIQNGYQVKKGSIVTKRNAAKPVQPEIVKRVKQSQPPGKKGVDAKMIRLNGKSAVSNGPKMIKFNTFTTKKTEDLVPQLKKRRINHL